MKIPIFIAMEALAEIHTLPQRSIDDRMDDFQVALSQLEQVECPLIHIFAPGIYVRKIFMRAITINKQGEQVNTVVISKIHKTRHVYSILKGSVAVYNKQDDFLGLVEAGYTDITEAGTRRILQIVEDCVWCTHHVLPYITGEENDWDEDKKAELLKRIEKDLIEEREGILSVS